MAVETPDLGICLRTYLRESTTLASSSYLDSATRIFVGFPRDKDNKLTVPEFTNMIVILPGKGGQGDIGLAQRSERVDFCCYGSSEAQAYKIWRALAFYLNPIGIRRKTYFTRNSCQVNTIIEESGPLKLVDPDAANWPYTLSSWIVNFNAEPRP